MCPHAVTVIHCVTWWWSGAPSDWCWFAPCDARGSMNSCPWQAWLGRDAYEVGPENPMRTPPGARTNATQTPSMILVGGRTDSAPAASASS
jgi:hypothetical protein